LAWREIGFWRLRRIVDQGVLGFDAQYLRGSLGWLLERGYSRRAAQNGTALRTLQKLVAVICATIGFEGAKTVRQGIRTGYDYWGVEARPSHANRELPSSQMHGAKSTRNPSHLTKMRLQSRVRPSASLHTSASVLSWRNQSLVLTRTLDFLWAMDRL
jgi:hypothetical protein